LSALRKLVGQTAIYGLSASLVLCACGLDPNQELVGTWQTPVVDGKFGVAQFHEKGGLRTWAEPRPPEGSNHSRAKYFVLGDSIGLVGEMLDTTLYALNWLDRDHVELINSDRTISLTRKPE
jgi:hypothetical protein